jgi:hypothetical protein
MGTCEGIWQGPVRLIKIGVGGIPEGDASSRWLIDIRIDRFQRAMIAIVAVTSAQMQGPTVIRWLNLRG